ncbi:MAG: FHA domain-containing protein, partial [Patescibacteria group bacterium]|nr:FHA domain-containing protein [Patescibacteria group bacterium]
MWGRNAKGTRDDERLMLWVDSVGGYWVCLADAVVLGQPGADSHADVPILGDVASRHARIRRDGEGYLLEAIHATRVDGKPVQRIAPLADGSMITLGESVRLRFRRPHALS